MPLQHQKIAPMKAGTRKQLDSGLKVARACTQNNLQGRKIQQCLSVVSTYTAVQQGREAQRAYGLKDGPRQFVLHEYCCFENPALARQQRKRVTS